MVGTRSYFDLNVRAAVALGSPATGLHALEASVLAAPSVGDASIQPRLATGRGDPDKGLAGGEIKPAVRVEQTADNQHPLPAETRWRPMSMWDQISMYFGVLLGVVFSSAVQQFKPSGAVNLNVTLGTLLVAALVALVIIPVVFEKLSVRPDAPFIVRFGLFVQSGVFWQVMISSLSKTFAA